MQRREMLAALGTGTAAITLTGTAKGATTVRDHHNEHIQVMAECAEACAMAASHCLDQLRQQSGDAEKHAKALEATSSCEEFCILSAKLAACGSSMAHLAHEANAQACDACAKACEGIDGQPMKDCMESCQKCAEACRGMAQQANQSGRPR